MARGWVWFLELGGGSRRRAIECAPEAAGIGGDAGPIPGLTQKVERIENYVTVKVERKQGRLEARAPDGHLIDSLELE